MQITHLTIDYYKHLFFPFTSNINTHRDDNKIFIKIMFLDYSVGKKGP